MDRRILGSKLYRSVCCCALFFVAASASFNGFYAKWHFRESGVIAGGNAAMPRENYGLAEMLDGTAARPFVHRQLVPEIANWLDIAVPERIKNACRRTLDKWGLNSPLVNSPEYSFRYFVVYVVTFLFAWLSVFAMHLVCRGLKAPSVACVFAPILMILLVPYFLSGGGYYYDYSELAFLALAVWMALKFDWWWLLPLVALATWNKESFLFISLTLYPILRLRHSSASSLVGVGLLALTCAAVYCAILSHFSQNPGGMVAIRLHDQLKFLSDPIPLITGRDRTYGIPTFRAFSLVPLALIVWTCVRGWRWLPMEIQRHAQIAAAINIPLFLVFSAPGEIRDFSMLYIVFMLLLAVNLTQELKAMGSLTLNPWP
jgi:hypothetical protein